MKKLLHMLVAIVLLGSLTVDVGAQAEFHTRTFNFTLPVSNTDGSPLALSAIEEVKFFCNNGQVGAITNIDTTWTSQSGQFPPGDYMCVATVVANGGVESADSNPVNFTVPGSVPGAIVDFTVVSIP